jgi:hypothetical protein
MPSYWGRREALGIAGALILTGLLLTLDVTVGEWRNHGDFTPFSMEDEVSNLVSNQTNMYATGPMKFLRTGYLGSEGDIYELRHARSGMPILHSVLLGSMAWVLGSLERAFIVGHAVFPGLIWILYYVIGKRWTGDGVVAAAVAWACTLVPFNARTLFLLSRLSWNSPLQVTRIAHPAVTFMALLVALSLLDWSVRAERPLYQAALAGLVSGTVFYAYYFYFVGFFLAAGLWLALALIHRRREVLALIAHLSGAVLTGIPYLWNLLRASRDHEQQEVMARVGRFWHGVTVPELCWFALSLALFWIVYWKFGPAILDSRWSIVVPVAAVVVAGWGACNLQFVTGYDARHLEHFGNRLIQPMTFVLLIALVIAGMCRWLSRYQMRRLALAFSLIVLLLAGYQHAQAGWSTAQYLRRSDPRMDALLWIRAHLPVDAVIGSSDDRLFVMISAITGNWSFLGKSDRTLASTQEITERFVTLSRVEGQDWPQIESHFRQNNITSGSKNEDASTSYNLYTRKNLDPRNLEVARRFWDHLDLRRELATRRLDFLIVPREASPLLAGSVVYENQIWKVVRLDR